MRSGKKLTIEPVELMFTVKEVASYLRVCEKTIRNENEAKRLGFAKVRGSLRIPESEFLAYVERLIVRSNMHG